MHQQLHSFLLPFIAMVKFFLTNIGLRKPLRSSQKECIPVRYRNKSGQDNVVTTFDAHLAAESFSFIETLPKHYAMPTTLRFLFISFPVKRLTSLLAIICLLITAVSWSGSAYGQCSSNNIEFNGSQPVYNGACNQTSYQTINGTTSPNFGTPYRWEYSLNGGIYQTVTNVSAQTNINSLHKNDITNNIIFVNSYQAGTYRIRRVVTIAGTECFSEPVYLYYSTAAVPVSAGTISGNSSGCSPASGTLTLSGNGGPVVRWESTASPVTLSSTWTQISNTDLSYSFSDLNTSTCYRAVVQNACGGNLYYSNVFCVNVYTSTATTISYNNGSGTNQFCATGTAPITISGVTGGSFGPVQGLDINTTTGAINLANSTPNTESNPFYTVTYNFNFGVNCSGSATTTIVIKANPTPTLSSSATNNTICAGAEVTFTAGGGSKYEFFVDGVSQGDASTINTFTTTSLTNNQNVKVEVTNENGCTATSGEMATAVNPNLPVSVTIASNDADNTICAGTSVTFTATPT
ncbi:hypothetical protein HRH25_23685, partial [Flavisolibacter sp. BT320]|nr:hypothetical protein [Flavisolibacter longurius]